MNSSSLFKLNADNKLSKIERKLYSIQNLINISFPCTYIDNRIKIKKFLVDKKLYKQWSLTDKKSSPSRKLSDLFWMNLPWSGINKELKFINMLDIGCGTGVYGVKMKSYSKNKINKYTGIDIKYNSNWNKLKRFFKNFDFIKSDIKKIKKFMPEDTNFIMSQSVLEHIEDDLAFFKKLKKHLLKTKTNTIQIHLFPSRSGYKIYPFHGVRQYTPRTISKITRIFDKKTYFVLFLLGGDSCNRLHYKYITEPIRNKGIDFRDIKTHIYDKKLFNAIRYDMKNKVKIPGFYALVIHSNYSHKLF